MEEIAILKTILKDNIQININSNNIEIYENQNVSSKSLKKVTITFEGGNIDLLGIKYDEETIKHKYIDVSNKDLNKGVDAILFLKKDVTLFIFLIELKSTERKLKEVSYKYLASMSFLIYLESILKFQFEDKTLKNFQIQPILFSLKGRLSKSMRPQKFDIKSNFYNFESLNKKISFLDISKVNPNNFEIKLSVILKESRGKDFLSWPL